MILHYLELIVRTLLKGNILHHEGIATIFAECHIVGGILRIPLVSQEVTSHGPSSLRSRRSGYHLLNQSPVFIACEIPVDIHLDIIEVEGSGKCLILIQVKGKCLTGSTTGSRR